MAKKTTKTEEKSIVKAVYATFQQENETVETRVEFEIQKFNIADAKIAELKNQFKDLEIQDVNDKNGIKAVTEAISIMRNLRTGLEKKRKELKDFYLSTGKGIDAEAKRIQELIADVEEPLKAKKDAIDAEIQRIKDEEEAREAKRIEDRVDALKEAGIVFDGTFYSIGENVSVDLITIKDMDDEAFEKLKSIVRSENEKIQAQKRIEELHENRKEHLLQFWSFLTEEQRQMNFGELTNEDFTFMSIDAENAQIEFEAVKQKQANEEQRLIQERRDFNFEKRSFKFEKIGFEIDEKGNAVFLNQIKVLQVSREFMETATEEQFEAEFESMVANKKDVEEKIETRKKADQEQADWNAKEESRKAKEKERLALLGKIEGTEFSDGVFYDYGDNRTKIKDLLEMTDSEFLDKVIAIKKEVADFSVRHAKMVEDARLKKLPDFEKIERYCDELMNVSIPQLVTTEAQKELQLLRNELGRIVQKAVLNVSLLK